MNEHELLIRQLFHIKQSGTVSEYVHQFCSLVDQLASYESKTDPLYYTLRFIDGLNDELKSSVLVQRPKDLDTACVLARLQEEVTGIRGAAMWRYLQTAGLYSSEAVVSHTSATSYSTTQG